MAVAALEPRVEILSADSMQVYRGMDIGTAKPTVREQRQVRHHLIDLVEPVEDFTVSQYATAVRKAAAAVLARGGLPVLVGGTGLYVRAAIDDLDIPGQYPGVRAELEADLDTEGLHRRLLDLDPTAAARMEPTNRRRVVRALEVTLGSGRRFSDWGPGLTHYPDIATRQVACDRPRPSLDLRIDVRYDEQMERGFLDEVRRLAAEPGGLSRTARQALGYRELLGHVEEEIDLAESLELAKLRTRRFARRQQRWFRRDPRIEWVDLDAASLDGVAASLAAALGDA